MASESTSTLETPPVEAEVWRLGPRGTLLHSVIARHASWLAEQEPESIFFYGDLGGSGNLTTTEETMDKVFYALSESGMSEKQIISAITRMQNSGIYFRESAI